MSTASPPTLRMTQPAMRVPVPPRIVTAVPRQASIRRPRSVTNEASRIVTRLARIEIIGLPAANGPGGQK